MNTWADRVLDRWLDRYAGWFMLGLIVLFAVMTVGFVLDVFVAGPRYEAVYFDDKGCYVLDYAGSTYMPMPVGKTIAMMPMTKRARRSTANNDRP
jgi:hypothetical protein